MLTLSSSSASFRGMPLVTLSAMVSSVNNSSNPWSIASFSMVSNPNHSLSGSSVLGLGTVGSVGGDLLCRGVAVGSRTRLLLEPSLASRVAFSSSSRFKLWDGESVSMSSSSPKALDRARGTKPSAVAPPFRCVSFGRAMLAVGLPLVPVFVAPSFCLGLGCLRTAPPPPGAEVTLFSAMPTLPVCWSSGVLAASITWLVVRRRFGLG